MKKKSQNTGHPDKTIWIAAGGTGGHISPGSSLAESLAGQGFHVIFFTLPRNLEYPDIIRIKEEKNIEVLAYPAPRIPRNIKSLFSFLPQLFSCRKLLKNQAAMGKPAAVIGMGGFPTYPALSFAKSRKIPYYLCEQNSVWGLITRLMAKKARRIFISFKPLEAYKKHRNIQFTGNPLRKAFTELPGSTSRPIWPVKKVLFIGGSQGASNLNELYLKIIEDSFFENYRFTVITGVREYDHVLQHARSQDNIFDFTTDIPQLLRNHDLIVSRAGSGVLYEIAWARKPSLLFPYPHATHDHQAANAAALVEAGAAQMIDIRPFDAGRAMGYIKQHLSQSKSFFKMKDPPLPIDAHRTIPQQVIEDCS